MTPYIILYLTMGLITSVAVHKFLEVDPIASKGYLTVGDVVMTVSLLSCSLFAWPFVLLLVFGGVCERLLLFPLYRSKKPKYAVKDIVVFKSSLANGVTSSYVIKAVREPKTCKYEYVLESAEGDLTTETEWALNQFYEVMPKGRLSESLFL